MISAVERGEPSRVRAPAQVDAVAVAATVFVLIGWFAMSSFVTEFGGLRQSFHFYQVWALVQNPAHLLTGLVDADRLRVVIFALVCIAAPMSVLVPYRFPQKAAWLAYVAPLVLMAVCGTLLYTKASADYVPDDGRYGALGSQLIHWANSAANSMGRAVARHISVGLGAYVSFIASAFLAVRGVLKFRAV